MISCTITDKNTGDRFTFEMPLSEAIQMHYKRRRNRRCHGRGA